MQEEKVQLGADEICQLRSRFIWKRMRLWWVSYAFCFAYFSAKSMDEFLIKLISMLIGGSIAGYILATYQWGQIEAKVIEEHLARQKGEIKRVPFSKDFHPIGLIVISGVGLLVIAGHFYYSKAILAAYVIPALIIGGLMLIQLLLDLRHEEEEYRIRTTVPRPEISCRYVLRNKWALLFSILLMKPLNLIPAFGVFFACMIFFYPYQRRLYLRSQREFGGSLQNQ